MQHGSPAATGAGVRVGTDARLGRESLRKRGVKLVRIGRFDSPLYVTAPPGDRRRLFVVEQTGTHPRRSWAASCARSRSSNLAGDISGGGEQGLLSMAFAPDYAQERRSTSTSPTGTATRAWRSSSAPRATRPRRQAPARRSCSSTSPTPNHNGGQLAVRARRLLYIGIGDGGSAGDPQHTGAEPEHAARQAPPHRPPPGGGRHHPGRTRSSGQAGRGEIWAYGLRNPWRFSFDRRPATSGSATSARTVRGDRLCPARDRSGA